MSAKRLEMIMRKRKKIGLILVTEPQLGGTHQYACLIASILLNYRDKYEIVGLCSNTFWMRWCKKNGLRYIRRSWEDYTDREKEWAICHPIMNSIYCNYMTPSGNVLRKEKIDLLICCFQGLFLPNFRAKTIHPVHDLMHKYEPAFPEVKGMETEKRELFHRSLVKFAAGVLVDSNIGRRQFIESYMEGSKKGPLIKVLPYIAPQYKNPLEEYVETPSKYIFYPAQFWTHKNHLNLLKAVQMLKRQIPDIRLVLAGSEKNSLRVVKGFITENGLEENVIIKGFVSNEQIIYLYKHAVGLIMPSYFGPTNLPPLEAMALGCPVAVANNYAMPEQVGEAGLLFHPDAPEEMADCILKMWKDEKLREEMIIKGYKRVDAWKAEDFEREFVKTVDRILGMK